MYLQNEHGDRTGVGIFNLHMGWLSLHRGPLVDVPIRTMTHCVHVTPANDMKSRVFGPPNFPRSRGGSNPGPLAPEASAMTTGLLRFYCLFVRDNSLTIVRNLP